MLTTLIYGLSADPVHCGHVALVRQAVAELCELGYELARTLIIPVYRRNPVGVRKDVLPLTYEHRCAMSHLVAQALQDEVACGSVTVSRIEEELAADREAPNYTAETLAALQAGEAAGTQLLFLLSSELVSGPQPQFARWHRVAHILELATLVICPRPGYLPNRAYLARLVEQGGRVLYLQKVQTPDVSSRELRSLLADGENPLELSRAGLLPRPVALYLREHNIYR